MKISESRIYGGLLALLVVIIVTLFGVVVWTVNEWAQGRWTDPHLTSSYVDKRVYGDGPKNSAGAHSRVLERAAARAPTPPVRQGQAGNLTAPLTTAPAPAVISAPPAAVALAAEASTTNEASDSATGGAGTSLQTGFADGKTGYSLYAGGWQSLPKAPPGVGVVSPPGHELRPPAAAHSVPEPETWTVLITGVVGVLLARKQRK